MLRRLILAAALCSGIFAVLVSSAYAVDLTVQSVSASAYPQVIVNVNLPGEAGGGAPRAVRVWENSVEIASAKIESLAQGQGPASVVLVIDLSGSMRGTPLANAKIAAARFVAKMRPTDQVAVVAFGSSPQLVHGFTSDQLALSDAITSLRISGETALYDGITSAVDVISASTARERAIVLLSDGKDTASATTLDIATTAARKAGVPIYAVGLQSPDYDVKALNALARSSGGRVTSVKDSASLVSIFSSISDELKNTYQVTFTSRQPNTPDLEVRLEVEGSAKPAAKTVFLDNPGFDAGSAPTVALQPKTLAEKLAGIVSVAGAVVLAALSVALLGFVGLSMIIRDRRPIDELAYYDQVHAVTNTADRAGSLDASRNRVMGLVDAVAESRGFTGLARGKLERAGLPLRPNEYMFLHFLFVVVVGLVVHVVFRSPMLTVIMVIVGVVVPILVLNSLETKRVKAFDEQLPDILTLIAGSLRAGWGLQQSIDLVVQQAADPAMTEFRRVQAEVRLGLPLDEALMRVAERIGSGDFRWTASAIAIQREVGGNLAEVLDTLAATIRERAELRRGVSALTAEGRFSAIVLGVLPFFLGGALFIINPRYASVLVNSWMGLAALASGLLLLIIGVVWLTRIVNIDV